MNCPFCKKTYKSSGKSFKDHVLKHDDKTYNVFKCGICDKNLKSRSSYNYHLKTHEEEEREKFACSICNSVFNCKYYRNIHQERHGNIKKIYNPPLDFHKSTRPRYILYEHHNRKIKRCVGLYETLQECTNHTNLSRDVLQGLYLDTHNSSVSNKLHMARLPKVEFKKKEILDCDLIFD